MLSSMHLYLAKFYKIHCLLKETTCFQERILYAPVVRAWMSRLEQLMEEHQFPPQLIFNMDETMIDASGHRVKVITQASSPRPFTENETKGEHISLALCISASGSFLRPLAILPLKTLPPLEPEVISFFSISGQENGFISNEIWHDWVRTVFIPHINRVRQQLGKPHQKVLFLVDSHSTRKYEPTIQLLNEAGVITYVLPAHSSTVLQPLDLTCHAKFKELLRDNFLPVPNEEKGVKRNRLLHTTIYCLQGALIALHIMNGFRRAGIYPFSKEAPLNSDLVRNPLQELNFKLPEKRKRGKSIAGKVLTNGESTPPSLPAPTPSPGPKSSPIPTILAPLNSAPKITLLPSCNNSIKDFMAM